MTETAQDYPSTVIASNDEWTVTRCSEGIAFLTEATHEVFRSGQVGSVESFETTDELLAWLEVRDHDLLADVRAWAAEEGRDD